MSVTPNRTDTLDAAKRTIIHDRQDQYGEAEDSFGDIAKMWSAYKGVPFTTFDVAMMMVLLKVARASSNPAHHDNLVDICGYAALASEMVPSDLADIHNSGR